MTELAPSAGTVPAPVKPVVVWLRRLVPLAVVLVVAAIFRLYLLDSLPPGLYYDEAFNGADVRSILNGESLPLFLAGNYGREPLFIYLQALVVAAIGYSALALRLTSALIGIATVGVAYWGAKNLWRVSPQQGQAVDSGDPHNESNRLQWIAFVVAAGLAVLYWHVSVSRIGLRAILLPPVSIAAMVFFWRGWCTERRRDFLWAGFWFGLAMYTYSAARFLPVVIALFIAVEWLLWGVRRLQGRPPGSLRLRGLLWMVGAGTLAILPLVVTFVLNPDLLTLRLAGVSVFLAPDDGVLPKDAWGRLAFTVTSTVASFYTAGDFNPRHNLPYRPVHDPLLATLFTVGWVWALVQIRQARHRLILLWLVVMAIPVVMSVPVPHALRGIGMLPPLILLYGVAADLLWRLLSTPRLRLVGGVLVVAVLMFSGVSTARDYFGSWARHSELGIAFDQDLETAATYVQQHLAEVKAGKPIVLTRRLFLSPQMRFAIGTLPWRPADSASLPVAGEARVLAENNADPYQAAFLLHAVDDEVVVTMLEELPPVVGAPNEVLVSPLQRPAWSTVSIYNSTELTATAHSIRYPLEAQFANGLRFLGYDMRPLGDDAPLAPSDYELITYWTKTLDAGPLNEGLSYLFTHLVYPTGQAQRNGPLGRSPVTLPLYPISLWRVGEVIDDRRLISVPPDAKGKAFFEIGLFNPLQGAGLERVSILDDQGNAVADQIQFGVVPLRMETPEQDLSQLQPLGAVFEQRARLEGWTADYDRIQPEVLSVKLGWRALERMPTDYKAFVHLLDGAGNILAQADLPPGGPENPTTRWLPDESVLTLAQLTLPPGAREQAQALRIGLYEPVSGRQLAITSTDAPVAKPGDTYVLVPLADLVQP